MSVDDGGLISGCGWFISITNNIRIEKSKILYCNIVHDYPIRV